MGWWCYDYELKLKADRCASVDCLVVPRSFREVKKRPKAEWKPRPNGKYLLYPIVPVKRCRVIFKGKYKTGQCKRMSKRAHGCCKVCWSQKGIRADISRRIRDGLGRR